MRAGFTYWCPEVVDLRVVHDLVASVIIDARLVGEEDTFGGDVLAHDRHDVVLVGFVDVETAGFSQAVDQGHNGPLVTRAARLHYRAFFLADVSFVDLHHV